MSQSYSSLVGTDTLTASRTIINNNLDALLSSFSGTAFPSSPVVGQHCLRTDQQKIYVCQSTGPSVWYLKVDLAKTMLTREDADLRFLKLDGTNTMAGAVNLQYGGKLQDQNTGGIGNVGRTLLFANNDSLEILKEDGSASLFALFDNAAAPTFKGQAMWHAGNFSRFGKNYLINGCFRINQRGASGGTGTGAYWWDRWAPASGTAFTVSASNVVTMNGSVMQPIEDPGLAGEVVTVSVQDPSVNITVAITDYANGNSVSGVITAGSGRRGVTLTVSPAATSHIKVTLTTASSGTFKNVQLEKGAVASEFEWRFRGAEAALCQRYYSAGNAYHIFGVEAATYGQTYRVPFPTSMRTVPTVGYNYTS